MQEEKITVFGTEYKLDLPFMVLATQNPIEMEGTYPLPEAQIDRFFFKLKMNYPDHEELLEIIDKTTEDYQPELKSVVGTTAIQEMNSLVKQVPIASHVKDYAIQLVLASHPDVVYLVTGKGESEDTLRRLVGELGLGDHVVFGGSVPADLLPGLYHACDVFVMASRRLGSSVEGFGIVCLEAAAAARPVIAGRSGGVADAVEDGVTGLLVDPEDPEAIGGAISRLLEDPRLARRMGEA